MTPELFAETYFPLAVTAGANAGVNPWTILAQWAIETGWGTSDLCTHQNNLAGIRWYGRPAQVRQIGGRPDAIGTGFAGYASLATFAADYAYVMGLPYYARVRAVTTLGLELTPANVSAIGSQCAQLGESPWDAGHYVSRGVVGGSLLDAFSILGHLAPEVLHQLHLAHLHHLHVLHILHLRLTSGAPKHGVRP